MHCENRFFPSVSPCPGSDVCGWPAAVHGGRADFVADAKARRWSLGCLFLNSQEGFRGTRTTAPYPYFGISTNGSCTFYLKRIAWSMKEESLGVDHKTQSTHQTYHTSQGHAHHQKLQKRGNGNVWYTGFIWFYDVLCGCRYHWYHILFAYITVTACHSSFTGISIAIHPLTTALIIAGLSCFEGAPGDCNGSEKSLFSDQTNEVVGCYGDGSSINLMIFPCWDEHPHRNYWYQPFYLSAYARQPARGPTMLAHLVAMLAYLEGNVGPSWGYVGLSWGQCGPILGLCWPILDPSRLAHLGAMLAHLAAYVGPCYPS